MKILTTNSTRNDVFGGIHTRMTEQMKYSPENKFHIVELNREKNYIPMNNCVVYLLDRESCTEGRGLFGVLKDSRNFQEFGQGVEKLVNEYQNIIQDVNPDIILIPGTSLTSYLLYKASRRERALNKTVQEYAGVLEKEIGGYSGDQRYILGQVGKEFVSPEARNDVTYIFPSKLCKDTVEEIHGIGLDRSHIIYSGVSEEFLSASGRREVPDEVTLGYVGRVHPVKNLPFFLNLNEGRNVKLKIITDLYTAAEKPSGKLLFRKMTDNKVSFDAPRSKKSLARYYSTELSASVVSSFFETFCNGATESVVSGTPCLLSDRAGAREVFESNGLDSLVYSIEDPESFDRALKSAEGMGFRIDPELSESIYEDLSWEKTIGRYNHVFEEVVSYPKPV